jgi:ribonuclease HI
MNNTAKKPTKEVILYTDGACRGNPGIGGWGYVIISTSGIKKMYGGLKNTTNNQMELTAVIKGLQSLRCPCIVDVYSDSKYVTDGINAWLRGWKRRGWKTATGQPVKNEDLWRAVDELMSYHKIKTHWVKGHSGDTYNDIADNLANIGADEIKNNI